MKEIHLTKGMVTRVSDHWFEYLNQFKWNAQTIRSRVYATRRIGIKTVFMHREIMGVTDTKTFVDHIDGDGLNNQEHNLRECNNSQNLANRGKTVKNTSGYKGVSRYKGIWAAEVWKNGKKVFHKTFASITDAAHAYDKAAKEHHGEFARLNFPE